MPGRGRKAPSQYREEAASVPLAAEILLAFQKFEARAFATASATLSARVRRGKLRCAREGYWIHGQPPLGTHRVDEASIRTLEAGELPAPGESTIVSGRGRLCSDQVEVGRVILPGNAAGRRSVVLAGDPTTLTHWSTAAERFLDGTSLTRIANSLHHTGLQGKRGGRLDHAAVRAFLTSGPLVGKILYTYEDEDGSRKELTITARWSALVDETLWEAVQNRMEGRASGHEAADQEGGPR